MAEKFRDRHDAGRQLGAKLLELDLELEQPVVLALPRGGVPVGAEVAAALGAPLDAIVARKVGAPTQPELAMGAVAEGGAVYVNTEVLRWLGVDRSEFDARAAAVAADVERRVERYRGTRPLPTIEDRDIVLVDDGLATGATAIAAIEAIRRARPNRIILAVPVCGREADDRFAVLVDALVAVTRPLMFSAVGQSYRDFRATTDAEVLAGLPTQR